MTPDPDNSNHPITDIDKGNKMAAKQVKIEFVRTYATEINAVKAAEAFCSLREATLRYIVIPVETDKGLRYGVAFLGEVALQHMVHFKFNVVG